MAAVCLTLAFWEMKITYSTYKKTKYHFYFFMGLFLMDFWIDYLAPLALELALDLGLPPCPFWPNCPRSLG
jgi:hypothetical protein